MQYNSYSCFQGHRHIVTGALQQVALKVKQLHEGASLDPVLIFDNSNGRSIDIDTRGTQQEVASRFAAPAQPADPAPAEKPQGRGRPKLGVVAREVTLLPRHWDWLSAQPGGASVTLRKLVEEARRANGGRDNLRQRQERAYHFMSAIAGDLPGFEESCRALFANDRSKFAGLVAAWPTDIAAQATALAFGDGTQPKSD